VLKFLLVVIVFAAATYLAVRAIERRGLMPDRPTLPKRPQPRKMVAPDDDEDFLRDLDRKRLNPEDPDG
jgi:hypothetical protein